MDYNYCINIICHHKYYIYILMLISLNFNYLNFTFSIIKKNTILKQTNKKLSSKI